MPVFDATQQTLLLALPVAAYLLARPLELPSARSIRYLPSLRYLQAGIATPAESDARSSTQGVRRHESEIGSARR